MVEVTTYVPPIAPEPETGVLGIDVALSGLIKMRNWVAVEETFIPLNDIEVDVAVGFVLEPKTVVPASFVI